MFLEIACLSDHFRWYGSMFLLLGVYIYKYISICVSTKAYQSISYLKNWNIFQSVAKKNPNF